MSFLSWPLLNCGSLYYSIQSTCFWQSTRSCVCILFGFHYSIYQFHYITPSCQLLFFLGKLRSAVCVSSFASLPIIVLNTFCYTASSSQLFFFFFFSWITFCCVCYLGSATGHTPRKWKSPCNALIYKLSQRTSLFFLQRRLIPSEGFRERWTHVMW